MKQTSQKIRQVRALSGTITLPADKSIAHRSAMFAALADGPCHILGFPDAADPQSTLSCMRQLGVDVQTDGDQVHIDGCGLHGLKAPAEPLDCGNSGTTMRLLAGILAGQPFDSILVGDASLSRRPMSRIVNPLHMMGANLSMTEGHAPLHISGNRRLKSITYELPVASAQVKSCVLLAGLYADGTTTVIESLPSRDHTERMLNLETEEIDGKRHIHVHRGHIIEARTFTVPSDFSAAAFFLVAGSIVPKGELLIRDVGLNPTRTGLLTVLLEMGADISIQNRRTLSGESIADLLVRPARLRGVTVEGAIIPSMIDEIPVLAVAATCAEGRTVIKDAGELRVKETDRIAAMETNLRAMGAEVSSTRDTLTITGRPSLQGATVATYDDHRIAMSMGVAALVAEGETEILEPDIASVSFPDFWKQLERVATR